ncbi:HAD domain-containing protein [Catenulispora pinisilvae]|uniref:HAD domain-containing protein n=1 Tax=Catenulispora pinisilvae TaxID=2705253 RepID=UPI0018914893|nr:HAD domain-containing protein [Catenulispora pinisilvae]
MPRPVLLLDVDGVLNPYSAVECPPGFAEHSLFPGAEPVRLCRAHGIWINRLRQTFDVVWATSWNHDANRLLAPLLGVTPLPLAHMPSPPFHPREKVRVIARFVGTRPAVWIDDQHPPEARTWSSARPQPTLLIPVDPATGLTREAVDRALEWARDEDPSATG